MKKYLFYFDSGQKQSTLKSRSDTELYMYTLFRFNQTIPLCDDKTGLTGGFLGAEQEASHSQACCLHFCTG